MKLRTWRKQQDISLDEMAFRIGVAVPTLVSYENGSRRPKAKTAQKIEAITKGAVSAGSLLGLTSRRPRAGRGVREDAEPFAGAEQLTIDVAISADQSRLLLKQGLDIEAIARSGAEKAIKEAEARAWAEANRDAIEASNRWIEKHGTLAEQLGLI